MHKIKMITFLLFLIMAISGAELTRVAQTVANQGMPLSNAEIIGGLKDALLVGTYSSVTHLSAIDGYLKDLAVKILLPPENRRA